MKLKTKLLFAFISIVLLMGLTQSIFLQSKIKSTFEDYLEQQNTGSMKRMEQNLVLYYKSTGSWENVQERYFSQTGIGRRTWDDAQLNHEHAYVKCRPITPGHKQDCYC